MSDNRTVLKTENLKSHYVLDVYGSKKVVKAVDDVDLEIRENEIYGIAGESGCGKTTLIKTLYALIKPPLRLIDGKVIYTWDEQDVDIYSLGKEEIRRLRWNYIAYIPQGAMSIFNPVIKLKETYRDFLDSHLSGKTEEEMFEIAREHIDKLGLPIKILDAYPHQLSGGMRQRVAIALAALLKPKVIFADEPTTALDVVVQRGVVQLLKSIQDLLKNTIILVTHDMGIHANITDRLAIMYAGKVIEEATTRDIFKNPLHPYTQFLINSLPKFGDTGKRASAPGNPPSLINLPTGCPFHPRCPHVTDICKKEMPQLKLEGSEHKVACWLMNGGDDE
ncbi:MAG TPA: ABC transporter ATP-binding protein [Halanaerobiales bacterium]|nr:ABC transporter ATP-binding protein [Halanaerobiales bacterium]